MLRRSFHFYDNFRLPGCTFIYARELLPFILYVGTSLSLVRQCLTHTYLHLGLSCYPLATIFFPVMWSLNFAYEGDDVPLSVWIVMSIHMILRRFGDFASM